MCLIRTKIVFFSRDFEFFFNLISGYGGSILAFNPHTKIAFAYVPNFMGIELTDPRANEYLELLDRIVSKK